MLTTVMTARGQIAIPTRIRRKFNIKKGDRLRIEERSDEIILKPITADFMGKIPGILPTKGKLAKMLLDERKKDKIKET